MVDLPPQKNMKVSWGLLFSTEWKNKTRSKPPTSYINYEIRKSLPYPSIHLPIYQSIHSSINPSIHLSTYPGYASIHLSVRGHMCPHVRQSHINLREDWQWRAHNPGCQSILGDTKELLGYSSHETGTYSPGLMWSDVHIRVVWWAVWI